MAALALRLSQAKVIRSGTVEIGDLAEGVVKEGIALSTDDEGSENVEDEGRIRDEL